LGAVETDLPLTGEVIDLPMRAEYLDEGIDLIRTLWEGGTKYHGRHFHYECERSDLTEVVRPERERIPIWVVGVWPRPKSMRRVLRCDGILPQYDLRDGRDGTPDDIKELRAWLSSHETRPGLDVIAEGETSADDQVAAAAVVAPWAQAGCTW